MHDWSRRVARMKGVRESGVRVRSLGVVLLEVVGWVGMVWFGKGGALGSALILFEWV